MRAESGQRSLVVGWRAGRRGAWGLWGRPPSGLHSVRSYTLAIKKIEPTPPNMYSFVSKKYTNVLRAL